MRTILITGGAGFLGYHVAKQLLLDPNNHLVIVDSFTDYYSIPLKYMRFDELRTNLRVAAYRYDINDQKAMKGLFAWHKVDVIIHLAAQAGVRYSEINPAAYATANVLGTTNVLSYAEKFGVKHVLYASSSSVYSGSHDMPYREDQVLPRPLSYYAITKWTNEMSAQHFTDRTGIPSTGLRFFTAYGPNGRPDMAYWKFTEDILAGNPIKIYGEGEVMRDFTYCEDVARAVELLIDKPQGGQVVNVGNSQPEYVTDLVGILSELLGKPAVTEHAPLPASDPMVTFCDNTKLHELTGFRPDTSLRYGLEQFVTWYLAAQHTFKKVENK